MKILKIGTRGSELALAQAREVEHLVKRSFPEIRPEITVIKTSGDKDRVRSLVSFGGQGVFVKEIEDALLEGKIDLAVHSLKDVPESMDLRLELSGFLKRADFRDVLVSGGKSFFALKPGAVVGTGSPRRVLQLKALRPDVHFVNLRGNLPSRVEKVRKGELDAIVLGAAGLSRLGLGHLISETFPVSRVTPAIGQGIIALQTLKGNRLAKSVAEQISDDDAETAARAERLWMHLLGGGCRVPMGAILDKDSQGFCFTAYLASPETGRSLRQTKRFSAEELNHLEANLTKFAEEFSKEAKALEIPLPSDVSSMDALLNFWASKH